MTCSHDVLHDYGIGHCWTFTCVLYCMYCSTRTVVLWLKGASHVAGKGPEAVTWGIVDCFMFRIHTLQHFFLGILGRQVGCALQHQPCTGSIRLHQQTKMTAELIPHFPLYTPSVFSFRFRKCQVKNQTILSMLL